MRIWIFKALGLSMIMKIFDVMLSEFTFYDGMTLWRQIVEYSGLKWCFEMSNWKGIKLWCLFQIVNPIDTIWDLRVWGITLISLSELRRPHLLLMVITTWNGENEVSTTVYHSFDCRFNMVSCFNFLLSWIFHNQLNIPMNWAKVTLST